MKYIYAYKQHTHVHICIYKGNIHTYKHNVINMFVCMYINKNVRKHLHGYKYSVDTSIDKFRYFVCTLFALLTLFGFCQSMSACVSLGANSPTVAVFPFSAALYHSSLDMIVI